LLLAQNLPVAGRGGLPSCLIPGFDPEKTFGRAAGRPIIFIVPGITLET
jgi:hypothetical protein